MDLVMSLKNYDVMVWKPFPHYWLFLHYNDVTLGAMASQITSLTIVYSSVYSVADQRKHQSSASLAFLRGIHRWPVNSPHKGPVTRKMLPFNDVIMERNSPVTASGFLSYRASNADLWYVGWTNDELLVIWDALALMCHHFNIRRETF